MSTSCTATNTRQHGGEVFSTFFLYELRFFRGETSSLKPFFFSFLGFDGSFTRYSPKLFLAWTIFYDVSLERKTALRRWNNKVIQLWGAFSCATERTRIGTPLIIFGKKPSPSLAHTRTLFNGGGGFGFTHAIFFSPQQNGIPSNVEGSRVDFFSSFTSTRR